MHSITYVPLSNLFLNTMFIKNKKSNSKSTSNSDNSRSNSSIYVTRIGEKGYGLYHTRIQSTYIYIRSTRLQEDSTIIFIYLYITLWDPYYIQSIYIYAMG